VRCSSRLARRLSPRLDTSTPLAPTSDSCKQARLSHKSPGAKARPGEPSTFYATDDHARHVEATSVFVRAAPTPFTPQRVRLDRHGDELGAEVRDTCEDSGPVGSDLIGAHKRPIRVNGLLAVVIRSEQRHERVDVVRIHRPGQRGGDRLRCTHVRLRHGPSLAGSGRRRHLQSSARPLFHATRLSQVAHRSETDALLHSPCKERPAGGMAERCFCRFYVKKLMGRAFPGRGGAAAGVARRGGRGSA
jgi:hypothetical protein